MKKVYGRFQQKHDTEANWLKAKTFAPLAGELIIYDPDDNYDYPRFKVGIWDGESEKTDDMLVNNLPFATSEQIIESGEGLNSIINIGANNQAISESSIALGENSKAGAKGYRIKAVDFENKKIYVTTSAVDTVFTYPSDAYATIEEFQAVAQDDSITDLSVFAEGTQIIAMIYGIREGGTEPQTYHYTLITSAWGEGDGNAIAITSDLGFVSIEVPKTDDEAIGTIATRWYNTLYIPSNPNIENGIEIMTNATAIGLNAIAAGEGSFAAGAFSVAADAYAHTEGKNTYANYASHAEGANTTASGVASHAEGNNTLASGSFAHAEGYETTAKYIAHAEGNGTVATGACSHAEGYRTEATGDGAHSEGTTTHATGNHSHAEGEATTASGNRSHAEGQTTEARAQASHSEGYSTIAAGTAAHAEGYITTASGYAAHAEGVSSTYIDSPSLSDDTAVITEWNTHKFSLAKGAAAHVEGKDTLSLGNYAHAEGHETIASSESTHAEGRKTIASGVQAHAEGFDTKATGNYSHAEGVGTEAKNSYSHTGGYYTKTSAVAQTAIGMYNADDGQALFIVGNGHSDTNRKNAFTVKANGTAYVGSKKVLVEGDAGEINTFHVASSITSNDNTQVSPIKIQEGSSSSALRAGYDGVNIENSISSAQTQIQAGKAIIYDGPNSTDTTTRIEGGTIALTGTSAGITINGHKVALEGQSDVDVLDEIATAEEVKAKKLGITEGALRIASSNTISSTTITDSSIQVNGTTTAGGNTNILGGTMTLSSGIEVAGARGGTLNVVGDQNGGGAINITGDAARVTIAGNTLSARTYITPAQIYIANNDINGTSTTIDGGKIALTGATSGLTANNMNLYAIDNYFNVYDSSSMGRTQIGSGSFVVKGATDYSGQTSIFGGMVTIGADSSIPELGGNLVVESGTTSGGTIVASGSSASIRAQKSLSDQYSNIAPDQIVLTDTGSVPTIELNGTLGRVKVSGTNAALQIGDTIITEAQLIKIINLIDSMA